MGSFVGQVVTTLADDGLRVRSQPRISDDSEKYDPLLPLGTQLYVLDGPMSASGYTWYQVAPLTSTAPDLGPRTGSNCSTVVHLTNCSCGSWSCRPH